LEVLVLNSFALHHKSVLVELFGFICSIQIQEAAVQAKQIGKVVLIHTTTDIR
jgi:hypothetical protein